MLIEIKGKTKVFRIRGKYPTVVGRVIRNRTIANHNIQIPLKLWDTGERLPGNIPVLYMERKP